MKNNNKFIYKIFSNYLMKLNDKILKKEELINNILNGSVEGKASILFDHYLAVDEINGTIIYDTDEEDEEDENNEVENDNSPAYSDDGEIEPPFPYEEFNLVKENLPDFIVGVLDEPYITLKERLKFVDDLLEIYIYSSKIRHLIQGWMIVFLNNTYSGIFYNPGSIGDIDGAYISKYFTAIFDENENESYETQIIVKLKSGDIIIKNNHKPLHRAIIKSFTLKH